MIFWLFKATLKIGDTAPLRIVTIEFMSLLTVPQKFCLRFWSLYCTAMLSVPTIVLLYQ